MPQSDTLIQDIVSKIHFRLVDQNTPGALYDSADLENGEGYKALDVANTHINDLSTPIFNVQLLMTPRLSTVAIGYIINRLVKNMPSNLAYLNIGTWCGFSFFAGMVGNGDKICIGVDNFTNGHPKETKIIFEHQYGLFKTQNSSFFEGHYEEYFKRMHTSPLGVYFYDGNHEYEYQLRGLELADPFLAPGAYVLVDDTNDDTDRGHPRRATMDFIKKKGGQYTLLLDAKTPSNGHPTYWNGLMILRKN